MRWQRQRRNPAPGGGHLRVSGAGAQHQPPTLLAAASRSLLLQFLATTLPLLPASCSSSSSPPHPGERTSSRPSTLPSQVHRCSSASPNSRKWCDSHHLPSLFICLAPETLELPSPSSAMCYATTTLKTENASYSFSV